MLDLSVDCMRLLIVFGIIHLVSLLSFQFPLERENSGHWGVFSGVLGLGPQSLNQSINQSSPADVQALFLIMDPWIDLWLLPKNNSYDNW